MGIPQAFADLVRVVPFNDLAEAERAFAENEGRIAGMIVEPAMMNCGVVLPQPGYLQGLLDLCHRHGAYLAFDEVKTGGDDRVGRRRRGVRRAARHRDAGEGVRRRRARAARSARPRSSSVPSSAAITTSPGRSTGTR